jgi:hypothetical protein
VGLLGTIKAAQCLRAALVTVMEADCPSLTDCSCGLGGPLPVPEVGPSEVPSGG